MAARLSPILAGGAALAACLGAAPAAAVDIGGAVRTNYALRTWDEAERDRGGELDAELLRLDLDGEIGGLLLSAEYRVCPGFGFDTVHHAWVGYDVAHWRARLGIVQVPFGLLPFASHSWWLGIGYYLGLEDDYDAGVVWESRGTGPHGVQLAFFKQQELGSGDWERYSFDIVRGTQAAIRRSRTRRSTRPMRAGPIRRQSGRRRPISGCRASTASCTSG